MANTNDELKEVIRREMEEWSMGFIHSRIAFLSRSISKSGLLTDSMYSEINKQARQEAVELLIAFSEHGRFIDMKPTAHDKWGRNAILRLEDWVERTGLSNFVKGWEKVHGKRPIDDNKLLNRIAWGIIRRRSLGKYRRRRWWNSSKQRAVSELFNNVAEQMLPVAADQVAASFNFKEYAKVKGRE